MYDMDKQRKKRLPVYNPIPKPLKIIPNRRQHQCLEALAKFHYLTAEQLSDVCGYSRKTLPTTRVALSHLFHARYVRRPRLLMDGPFGSAPLVYALAKKGYAYLGERGTAPKGRFRAAEEAQRETIFLKHTLAANAFLVRVIILARQHQQIQILRMIVERDLKRIAVRVRVKVGRDKPRLQSVRVVPDGYVQLQFPDRKCELLLELDRGTVDRERMQTKVQSYLPYVEQHYRDIFQAENPVILFVTTAGSHRLEHLVKWTEDELEHCHAKHKNALFRFAACDPNDIRPEELFFSPIWIGAFSRTPIPLFRN